MASRREQKERLKQERLALERAAAARARRATVVQRVVPAALALGLALVVAIASGLGRGGASNANPGRRGAVALSRLSGLATTAPPWGPEYGHLAQRLGVLGLPPVSDVIYHVHSLLHVYVDGRPVTVPANLGIAPGGDAFSSLHTHDTTGVLHMEATRPFPFRLSDVFAVWGVAFGPGRLGGLHDDGASRLWVYANGRRVADPLGYVIRPHDNLVVAYGRRGSFPKTPSTAALAGL